MISGIAEVVAVVESEKKVEFCVVSSARDHVYDDCSCNPFRHGRRTSTMSARYQESPSLDFTSMLE
jgi:hypothetical protein